MAYVATICILVDVTTEGELLDAIAETMRPLMKPYNPQSCLRDWMWAEGENEIIPIGSIPSNFNMDDEWPWALDQAEA